MPEETRAILGAPATALTVPASTATPIARAPLFVSEPNELEAVLSAQGSEIRALKLRLAAAQRECGSLRVRLRDAGGELASSAEATANATERLEAHSGRQGLVLAAGVERCSAERAALCDELQRTERLLAERDREIAQLRRTAQELHAESLHGELQLAGLAYNHQAASTEAIVLGANVEELRQRIGSMHLASAAAASPALRQPSQHEAALMGEANAELLAKEEERAALARRAEAATNATRTLEAQVREAEANTKAFEQNLRARQDQMYAHDRKLVREAAELRTQCEGLRSTLRVEQSKTSNTDQSIALEDRCRWEASTVRQEAADTLVAINNLVPSLRARGRCIRSPEVPGDPIDARLHQHLSGCGCPGGDVAPPVAWRLGPGEYLIGEDHVKCSESHGRVLVTPIAGGQCMPLRDLLRKQVSPNAWHPMEFQSVNV